MVAKITCPTNFRNRLYYHEQKVDKNDAYLIDAANFLQDAGKLTVAEKIQRFEMLHLLNKRVRRPVFHVILRFDPIEMLDDSKLVDIASEYMNRIGFGGQPSLVYRHIDAAIPHIHVLSTLIRHDGSRINPHNIGKDLSEPARKFIEEKFGLIKAQERKKERTPQPVQRLQYGKAETIQSITDTVEYILLHYNFTSLIELNAILKLYNLRADTGKPGGRIHREKGILYQILDEKGKGRGHRVKASSMPFKATMITLEKLFHKNNEKRPSLISRLKTYIGLALRKKPAGWKSLTNTLRQEKIGVLPLMNKDNAIYELLYIDNHTKMAVASSDLGPYFTPSSIFGIIGLNQLQKPSITLTKGPDKPLDPRLVAPDSTRALSTLENLESLRLSLSNKQNKRHKRTL